jgi:hypothetical protein
LSLLLHELAVLVVLPFINKVGALPPTVALNVPEIVNSGFTVTVNVPVQFEDEVNVITAVD